MGEKSKIEWTDHTFNPWRGCTKRSAGCDHCYAETMSKRNPAVLGVWGPDGARAIAAPDYWKLPEKWDAAASAAGRRDRVFCGSLMDVFEGEDTMPAASWSLVQQVRGQLWSLIEATPHLDYILVTKRPENAVELATPWRGGPWPSNVWVLTSVEDQTAADQRIPALLRIPARVRGLSCEPLLGPVNLPWCNWCGGWGDHDCYEVGDHSPSVDWIIAGGESGPHARPMHPDWALSLRDQAAAAGVPFFFKQWGEYLALSQMIPGVHCSDDDPLGPDDRFIRPGKHAAGRLLDGQEWSQLPE